jgi:hypothetical protein
VRHTNGELLYTSDDSNISCSAASKPCRVSNPSQVPTWKETLLLFADYKLCLRQEENVALLFEIFEKENDNSDSQKKDAVIAWAFLKLVGMTGHPHTDRPMRVQLHRPPASSHPASPLPPPSAPWENNLMGSRPIAGRWLASVGRQSFNASLHMLVKEVSPTQSSTPTHALLPQLARSSYRSSPRWPRPPAATSAQPPLSRTGAAPPIL